MDRNERQAYQVSEWITKHKARGYLLAATGFGKTRVAVNAILECNRRDANRTIHVVVPRTPLKNSWLGKDGHIAKNDLKNVQVFVRNTYVKLERSCDLLIVDEVHGATNEDSLVFRKIINETKYNWFLGLSATLEQHNINFLHSRNIFKIDEVTLQECKTNEWVSDFEVVNFGVDLNEEDKKYYDKLHKNFNKYFATFNHDFDIAMRCLVNKDFRTEHALTVGLEEKEVMVHAVQWNLNMRKRKSFLYNTYSKILIGKELTKLNKKIICFSESVDFTQKLSEEIGSSAASYHSKNTVAQNKKALKAFIDNEKTVLCTAKSLDEGTDIPDADLALIFSRTSKQLQNVQRIGRVIRKQEDKKAFVVNLYTKNSQDEVWLKKASKGTKCLWLDDIEQLKLLINGPNE